MAKKQNNRNNTKKAKNTKDANMEIGTEPTNKTKEEKHKEKQKEYDAKFSKGRQ